VNTVYDSSPFVTCLDPRESVSEPMRLHSKVDSNDLYSGDVAILIEMILEIQGS